MWKLQCVQDLNFHNIFPFECFTGPEFPDGALPGASKGGDVPDEWRDWPVVRQHPGDRAVPASVSTKSWGSHASRWWLLHYRGLQVFQSEYMLCVVDIWWNLTWVVLREIYITFRGVYKMKSSQGVHQSKYFFKHHFIHYIV